MVWKIPFLQPKEEEKPDIEVDCKDEIKEVLLTLEKLYNDFTMRPDECKALDFAIKFIKENTKQ